MYKKKAIYKECAKSGLLSQPDLSYPVLILSHGLSIRGKLGNVMQFETIDSFL